MKHCSKCRLPLEDSKFSFIKSTNKLSSACKKCNNANKVHKRRLKKLNLPTRNKVYGDLKVGSSDYIKAVALRRNYGLTLEEYNGLFTRQEGKCAICRVHQIELKDKLCVDHNHETDKIRGLLCRECNFGLGKFKDNKKLLADAIAYLDKND